MFAQYLSFILVGPLQAAIVAWLCYEKIGIPALIGLTTIVFQLPIQGCVIVSFCYSHSFATFGLIFLILAFVARAFSQLRLQTAEMQDFRIRLMKEIIACMKLIKMHCWENSFADKTAQARKCEMGLIR